MRLKMSKPDPAEPADALKRYPIWEIVIHDSKLSIYPSLVKARLYWLRGNGKEVAERAGFEPARAR